MALKAFSVTGQSSFFGGVSKFRFDVHKDILLGSA